MIGELIEKLTIANIKLYMLCDKKADMAKNPEAYTKKQMAEVMDADIQLCKQRGSLKKQIDIAINSAIITGETSVIDEVKDYGSR